MAAHHEVKRDSAFAERDFQRGPPRRRNELEEGVAIVPVGIVIERSRRGGPAVRRELPMLGGVIAARVSSHGILLKSRLLA
jgi:hypothetical protein